MSAKAVYVSASFAVYLTGDELTDALQEGEYLCELFVGKERVPGVYVKIELGEAAQSVLVECWKVEREILARQRGAFREAAHGE